ncbi:MAG: putative ABC transporter permease [Lachnospiraceae bacterium]|nr:putative ABC transporter permease [Lachnospiraceae bacterium]
MVISQYFVEFILYSFLGWIWECTYVSFRTGHWDNRGFLHGPVCPIYGTGAVLASICFGSFHILGSSSSPIWQVFLISAAASFVLEYSTSWLLEKRFHAVWWDYSDMPLNIHGRVCLPATLAFGIAGVLIVRFVIPVVEEVKAFIPPLLSEAGALFFMAILSSDLVLTVQSLTDLAAKLDAAEKEFNDTMEARYRRVDYEKQLITASVKGAGMAARDRLNALAESLSSRQQYALRTVHHFSATRKDLIAGRLKEALVSGKERITREISRYHNDSTGKE